MEYGTPNVAGIAGLQAGVKWVEAQGVEALHAQEMKLLRQLRDGLAEIPGVILYCQADLTDHIAVLAFNVEGMDAGDVGTLIDVDHDIACRTGLHCAPLVHEGLGTAPRGAVRLSIGPFNTEEHIRTAIEAVAEVAEFSQSRS
jgi:selenocysteine lyase/cysteine desulfurase